MLLVCPECEMECTVDEASAVTATCPGCGVQLHSRTEVTGVLETQFADPKRFPAEAAQTQDYPAAVLDLHRLPIPDQFPQPLERYTLTQLLGQGGFAHVYRAFDSELGREVALKIPRPDRFATPERLQQFVAEAKTTAALHHPGIITIFDVGRFANGSHYISMEYVAGGTLSEFFDRESPPFATAVQLVIKIADAVHEAHLRGLVHRDLKPSNILLDERGEPRVVDFGLAVHESMQARLRGEVSGTPAYMAPEQHRGEVPYFDGRTDIWSLGCILYVALTGRRPFNGDLPQLRDEILNKAPKPLRQIDDEIPRELEAICLKCLAKELTDRFTTAKDLADDLRGWLNTTTGGPPTSHAEQPPSAKPLPEATLIRTPLPSPLQLLAGSVLLVGVAIVLPMIVAATHSSKPIENTSPSPTASSQRLALNPEQRDSALEVVAAKPLDDEPLLRAIPLIDQGRIPRKLSWPVGLPDDSFDYHLQGGRLSLQNNLSMCLVELGTTTANAIVLEAELSRTGNHSRCGLFWGWQQDHLDPHRKSCFLAELTTYPEANGVSRHYLCVAFLVLEPDGQDGFNVVDRQQLSAVDLFPPHRPEVGRLMIEVSRTRGLHSVTWGGQAFDELRTNAITVLKSQPNRYPKMRSAGMFGVYNSHGAISVRNPTLKIITKGTN